MDSRTKRESILSQLKRGAAIVETSGADGKANDAQSPRVSPPVEPSNGSAGVGTGPGTGTVKPASIARAGHVTSPEPRPTHGTHPRTGKSVEIDYSQPGADRLAPFGRLEDGTPRQRKSRTSARASTRTPTKAEAKSALNVFADAVQFVHQGVALATGHAHWEMSDEDASKFGEAILDVQAAYGVDLDPKAAAWIKLLTVCAVPTGARVMASVTINAKPKTAKVNAPAAASGQVAKPAKAKSEPALTPAQLNNQMGGADYVG